MLRSDNGVIDSTVHGIYGLQLQDAFVALCGGIGGGFCLRIIICIFPHAAYGACAKRDLMNPYISMEAVKNSVSMGKILC